MPEVNPYQPSAETPVDSDSDGMPPQRVYFFGGFLSLLAVSIVAGLCSAWLIGNIENQFKVYGPVIVWFLALMATHALLRGSQTSLLVKSALSLVLTLPACVLYFPVCFVSGAVSGSVFGGQGYGPNATGLALASVMTSALVLFLLAYIVRATGRSRARKQAKALWMEDDCFGDGAFSTETPVESVEPLGNQFSQQTSEPGNATDE